APDVETKELITQVRPFVRDTRNLLLVQLFIEEAKSDASFVSLGYALQRGMQVLFQVEQQEIAVESIGEGEERRLLYCEAAEGGNGIWQRLVEDPKALSRVAEEALRVCHFDPATGEEMEGWKDICSRGCYDCLLSYSNQPWHAVINRHAIRDYLMALSRSSTAKKTAERNYDEQYAWLAERRDQNSSLEGAFLKHLYETRRCLPDKAQHRPVQDVYAEADFYYERKGLPGVCIFCDGPDHDLPERKAADHEQRTRLRDLGYRVVEIRYDRGLEEQTACYADVFGPGVKQADAP